MLTQQDKDALEKLKEDAVKAATYLREAGQHDLADRLLVNAGYVCGLVSRLDWTTGAATWPHRGLAINAVNTGPGGTGYGGQGNTGNFGPV